jgi:putative hydroxymethylpyrimidine transport system ATP-binding protein
MIKLCNIHLHYKGQPLFQDFTLSFKKNRWTTLLGPSGVGKTTLLRLIAQLETAHSGSIECDGKVSYLSQTDSLLPWHTALKNVSPFKSKSEEKTKKALSNVGLLKQANKYPHELSGGMRQRVALARVLIEESPIVLLDEPFSAIDAVTKHDLQNLANHTLKNKTVIMVTHDPLEALRLSDQIITLKGAPVTCCPPLNLHSPTPRDLENEEVKTHYTQLMQDLHLAKEESIC